MRLWRGVAGEIDALRRTREDPSHCHCGERNLATANTTTQAPALDPAMPVQGTSATGTLWTMQKHMCMRLFIAALFIIAKCWNLPGGPVTGEYLNTGCTWSAQWSSYKKRGGRSLWPAKEWFLGYAVKWRNRNERSWVPAASLFQCEKEQKIRKRAFMGK